MAHTQEFLAALGERTPWVDEYLLAPKLLNRVRPEHLRKLVGAYLKRGGKRLRPAVLLFCCGAVGGDEKTVLPAAAALELFHTWTLMHDDIIDHDAMRRGGPSGHVLGAALGVEDFGLHRDDAADYGSSMSILAGDVQHGLCVYLMLGCDGVDPGLSVQLARDLELNVVCDLVEGEALDIQLEDKAIEEVELDEVLRMMYLKTGVLYEFAGKAGAMLGLGTRDEEHPQVNALREFCAGCGVAFQLQDDILGIVGDEKKLGKPVGSDITEGKRTPIVLNAFGKAGGAQLELLRGTVGNLAATDEQVRECIELIVSLGAVEDISAMARQRIEKAFEHLAMVPESDYTHWLSGWAEYMIARDF